jgi:hypothetical protein
VYHASQNPNQKENWRENSLRYPAAEIIAMN